MSEDVNKKWAAWYQGFPVTIVKQQAKWTVSVDRGLPVKETSSWDAAAARERIFSWANWDTDPDSAKARRCFLFFNSAAPDEKGSYMHPVADIVNGQPVISSAAMSASSSYLPKTKLPANVKANGRKALDALYRKLEKERA